MKDKQTSAQRINQVRIQSSEAKRTSNENSLSRTDSRAKQPEQRTNAQQQDAARLTKNPERQQARTASRTERASERVGTRREQTTRTDSARLAGTTSPETASTNHSNPEITSRESRNGQVSDHTPTRQVQDANRQPTSVTRRESTPEGQRSGRHQQADEARRPSNDAAQGSQVPNAARPGTGDASATPTQRNDANHSPEDRPTPPTEAQNPSSSAHPTVADHPSPSDTPRRSPGPSQVPVRFNLREYRELHRIQPPSREGDALRIRQPENRTPSSGTVPPSERTSSEHSMPPSTENRLEAHRPGAQSERQDRIDTRTILPKNEPVSQDFNQLDQSGTGDATDATPPDAAANSDPDSPETQLGTQLQAEHQEASASDLGTEVEQPQTSIKNTETTSLTKPGEDDFSTIIRELSFNNHSGAPGITPVEPDPPMSREERAGVTGPRPRMPESNALLRMTMDQLKQLARSLQGESYGTQNAPALMRLYEIASHHRPVNASDTEPFDPIGDPVWAGIDMWHQDAARYREYLSFSRRENHTSTRPQPQPPLLEVVERNFTNSPHLQLPHAEDHRTRRHLITMAGLIRAAYSGNISSGIGSVISSFVQGLQAGDQFRDNLRTAQQSVYNYCTSFARTIRGERHENGPGATSGAEAAWQVLNNLSQQNIDRSQFSQLSMDTLYGIAWHRIAPQVISHMENNYYPGSEGPTRFSRAMVQQTIDDTNVGRTAYRYFNNH